MIAVRTESECIPGIVIGYPKLTRLHQTIRPTILYNAYRFKSTIITVRVYNAIRVL